MSKNCSKTEEAPPLKKSLIRKVEKQYGKDNPKTYATLWKIYKNRQQTEEPANATGVSVAGTGDDSSVVKKKKKKKSPWDKYSPDALGRQFRMEEKKKKKLKSTRVVGEKPDEELEFWKEEEVAVAEPNITPDDTFAGVDVFKVGDNEYNNCKLGKKKYARWDKYVDVESETGKRITGYAKKHPKKSIIVQHDKTDHMLYLKKFEKGEE